MSTIIPFPAGRISRRPRARPIEDCISKVRNAIRILENHAEPRYRRRTQMIDQMEEDLFGELTEGNRGIPLRPAAAGQGRLRIRL